MQAKTKVCGRCSGKGYGPWVVNQGVCFQCNGRGEYIIDKFIRQFGQVGAFYGLTTTFSHGTFTTKSISRMTEEQRAEAMLTSRDTLKEITEAQARQFFTKYGTTAYVYPK